MIGLIQRVSRASVEVGGQCLGQIGTGLLVLVGVEAGDTDQQAARLAERLLGYRVFADRQGKMNLSVRDVGGGLLVISQFTLAADTSRGMRPGFSTAAPPDEAERLFNGLLKTLSEQHPQVQTGRFGADMSVSLVNDGPVSFWLKG